MKIYTPEEVAEILRVRPQTVLKWLRQGIMPGSKIQKKWRITEEDLKLFLEKNKNIGR